jgi:hypothetical protein
MNIREYVPILRWKAAERDALAKLDPIIRAQITPLFEFIMPGPKRDSTDYKTILKDSRSIFQDRLPKVVNEINKCSPSGSVFIDVHLVDGALRSQALDFILDSADFAESTLIPVTHIFPEKSSVADDLTRQVVVNYGRSSGMGLCIRIDRSSLVDQDLSSAITRFLVQNKLTMENTDVLVDLGIVDESDDPDGLARRLAVIPELNRWRSFIVAGGAFPKDLTQFEKHTRAQIPRTDWEIAKSLSVSNQLVRVPTFSDYTIQHPIFYENVTNANVSASIRYTGDNQWDVLRGEGLRNEGGAGHQQYIAHARLIVKQNFFKGANYSFGDNYIIERAQPSNILTGNPTTWLKAGINHHMTVVVKQLSSSFANKVPA